MKLITLLENNTIDKNLKAKHGLSFYIEVNNMKLLFDLGSDDTFIKNAEKLGVNLKDVDKVIISHGHFDHGGGLEAFMKINDKAEIYVGKNAFDNHIVKIMKLITYDIGLNKKLENNPRINIVDGVVKLGNNITMFNNVKGDILRPKGNDRLLKKTGKEIDKDDFTHELNLIVNEDGKKVLFSGCSHTGVINIISEGLKIAGEIDTVIGGFHLMDITKLDDENRSFMDSLIYELKNFDIPNYVTCHCTGETAISYLSERMENIRKISTGNILEI